MHDRDNCATCPVTDAPCLGQVRPGVCARAARPGQEAFRRSLVARAVPFPSVLERAGNLAGAVVAAVGSGGERASPEGRERRLSICRGCEHLDAEETRCRLCGCYLNLKVRLEAWHCPIDRW